MNPNSKIPAMYDYAFDPPIRLFESASIIMHVAEKEVANVEHIRQSQPHSGLGFQAKFLVYFQVVPCLLDYAFDPPIRLFESASIIMYVAEKEVPLSSVQDSQGILASQSQSIRQSKAKI